MRESWITLFASSLLAQTPVLQERPSILPLSLKRAVDIALAAEGNARVQLAEESVRQAQSRAAEARSALLPNFDATVSEQNQVRNLKALGLDFSSLPSIPGFHFPTVVGPFNVFDVRVSGAQNVFDFSAIRRFRPRKPGSTPPKPMRRALATR